MSDKTIGFIGVGRMGRHMSRRLLEAGHKVVAYDNNARALQEATSHGANAAHSPADVASQSEIVLVSLPTPDIVKAVALGDKGVSSGKTAKIFIDLSTTGPKAAMEVAQALKEKGITAIDAPVSGGPGGADKGTLAVMVSGPKALEKQVQPILGVIGKVFWVGEEPGMGQTMKVCNNLMSATAVAITSEALVVGTKAGLDPAIMLDVINAGSGRNTASADKFPRCVLPRKFDFGFASELLYKDVRLCLEEAERLGVPMIVGNAVRQLLAVTKATQGEGSDITETVKPLEAWAGVEVKPKASRS
jgi:3-hydroxyisobutyrate dehydrogenase-like beta-hydroxyacid dehydrogenase